MGDRVYKKYKGKEFTLNGCTGILAGFSDDRYILAVEGCKSNILFRRLDKDCFVEEDYKDVKFKFAWINEADMDAQSRGKKKQTYKSILC